MSERFGDVEIETETEEAITRIADAPEGDVAAIFSAAGIDVSPLMQLMQELLPDDRMIVAHSLAGEYRVDIDAAVLEEWAGHLGSALAGFASFESDLLSLSHKIDAGEAREILELALRMEAHRGATVTAAALVLSNAMRASCISRRRRRLIALRFDEATERIRGIRNETVAALNTLRAGSEPAVLLTWGAGSALPKDLLEDLSRKMRAALPANDVRLIEPEPMRGYGVTFVKNLSVWLPSLDPTDVIADRIVDIVREGVQAFHHETPRQPKHVSFLSPGGVVIRTLDWRSNVEQPEDIVVDSLGPPSERPK